MGIRLIPNLENLFEMLINSGECLQLPDCYGVIVTPEGKEICKKSEPFTIKIDRLSQTEFYFEHFDNIFVAIQKPAKLTTFQICDAIGDVIFYYPLELNFRKGDSLTIDFTACNILFADVVY